MGTPEMSYLAVQIKIIVITQNSLEPLALSCLQCFFGTFHWDETVVFTISVSHPKKCLKRQKAGRFGAYQL